VTWIWFFELKTNVSVSWTLTEDRRLVGMERLTHACTPCVAIDFRVLFDLFLVFFMGDASKNDLKQRCCIQSLPALCDGRINSGSCVEKWIEITSMALSWTFCTCFHVMISIHGIISLLSCRCSNQSLPAVCGGRNFCGVALKYGERSRHLTHASFQST